MRIYEYQRVSTQEQTLEQQHNTVQEYILSRGWTIDESVSDEGVSGSISYKDRNLYRLLQRMNEGDILIVSEISRLGRSMSDLNKLVNDEMKPRKLRLIIVKMGLDLDCSNLKAIDEMILFAFSFSSQIERELIKDRTQSAIDVRKKKLSEQGSFISRNGNTCTHLGRPKNCEADPKAIAAAANARRAKAKANPHNIQFYRYLTMFESRCGIIKDAQSISAFVQELTQLDFRTATGLPFDIPRCWQMIYKARKLFA